MKNFRIITLLFGSLIITISVIGQEVNSENGNSEASSLNIKKKTEYLGFTYFPDSLKCLVDYIDRFKNGNCECFYKNEMSAVRGKFKNNLKTGMWLFYRENGLLNKRILYHEDIKQNTVVYEYLLTNEKVQTSKMKYFSGNDSLHHIEYYKNGTLLRTETP